jgi:hypothetical protein
MFINAEPRVVSNGFEAFIPFHRAESVHQRLVEMTNNDVNAWSVCRPVASSTSSIWDQQVDDFGNENFSVNTSSEVEMHVGLIFNRFKAPMLDTSKKLHWHFQDSLSIVRRLLLTHTLTSPSPNLKRIPPSRGSPTRIQHLI